MAYKSYAGAGAELKIKNTGTFHLIEGANNISISGASKDTIETTAINATAKTFVSGTADFGKLSFSIYYDPADTYHAQLLTSYSSNNVTDDFELTLPDDGDAVVTFSAIIDSWELSLASGQAIIVNVGGKVTGAVTVTP